MSLLFTTMLYNTAQHSLPRISLATVCLISLRNHHNAHSAPWKNEHYDVSTYFEVSYR